MALKRKNFIIAFFITLVLFTIIILSNFKINDEREQVILMKMEDVLEEYKELETISLLSDLFGDEMTCLAFKEQLALMDKKLWSVGEKIDRYRELTKEFTSDPFYIDQKMKFNRNEGMYFAMLKKFKEKCDVDQVIILFFYKKKEECRDCDAQSFVLTDINKKIDPEISIFSFDADLNISSINLLQTFYGIDTYPCIVVEDDKHCGLMDKNTLIEELCKKNNLSICPT